MTVRKTWPTALDEPVDATPLEVARFAEIAKALAHPTRLCIVRQFGDGKTHYVREIVASCDLAQSTVSEHLRILRESGVLVAVREGPSIRYDLCRPLLSRFARSVVYLTARASIFTTVR